MSTSLAVKQDVFIITLDTHINQAGKRKANTRFPTMDQLFEVGNINTMY